MNIIMTGHHGYIGSHLAPYLEEKGHIVYGWNGDIRNFNSRYERYGFDMVIHLAALTGVRKSIENPEEYWDVNVNGTENVFKLSKKHDFKVVYASSSSVYGNPTRIPTKESDDKNPINPYAETKLKAEELAIQYSKMGVSVIGLRYFNVFGKRQSKEYAGVIKLFLEQIRNELPPKINGNGTQSRDFVHVDDVVNANIMSMNSDVTHEFFNVGTNSSITVRDLAKTVIEASGLDIEPIFGPGLEGDVDKTIANIDLIKQKIGWKPSVMLVDWLKEIISSKKIDEV